MELLRTPSAIGASQKLQFTRKFMLDYHCLVWLSFSSWLNRVGECGERSIPAALNQIVELIYQ